MYTKYLNSILKEFWTGCGGALYPCYPRTLEVEVQGSGIQDCPQILSESEDDLSYIRPCVKNEKWKHFAKQKGKYILERNPKPEEFLERGE